MLWFVGLTFLAWKCNGMCLSNITRQFSWQPWVLASNGSKHKSQLKVQNSQAPSPLQQWIIPTPKKAEHTLTHNTHTEVHTVYRITAQQHGTMAPKLNRVRAPPWLARCGQNEAPAHQPPGAGWAHISCNFSAPQTSSMCARAHTASDNNDRKWREGGGGGGTRNDALLSALPLAQFSHNQLLILIRTMRNHAEPRVRSKHSKHQPKAHSTWYCLTRWRDN